MSAKHKLQMASRLALTIEDGDIVVIKDGVHAGAIGIVSVIPGRLNHQVRTGSGIILIHPSDLRHLSHDDRVVSPMGPE